MTDIYIRFIYIIYIVTYLKIYKHLLTDIHTKTLILPFVDREGIVGSHIGELQMILGDLCCYKHKHNIPIKTTDNTYLNNYRLIYNQRILYDDVW